MSKREFMDMLSYRRPDGSKTEVAFLKKFILPLDVEVDHSGNHIKRIGTAPVLWSCHFDTVAFRGGRQKITSTARGIIKLAKRSKSNCLGADDTGGVWLMVNMIRAGVEGLYVFHRGEECGGIGSSFIAKHTPELLDGIKYAIALDRKGTMDVITHQFGRCCSDKFGMALAVALGDHWLPDDTGMFTDTANYTEIVPECTNLSIGYEHCHSRKEWIDFNFLKGLLDTLVKLDVTSLPVDRDPTDWDDNDYYGNCTSVEHLDDNWAHYWQRQDDIGTNGTGRTVRVSEVNDYDPDDPKELAHYVKNYPDVAALVLADYGVTVDEFLQILHDESGQIKRLRLVSTKEGT